MALYSRPSMDCMNGWLCHCIEQFVKYVHVVDYKILLQCTGKFVFVYLDDIIVFSNSDDEHLNNLKHVFQKCRRFGISLNPKKSSFVMQEGKLLGHVISKRESKYIQAE